MDEMFFKKEDLNLMKGWMTWGMEMGIDVDNNEMVGMIVNNSINCEGLDLYIDHVIGVIDDEEAEKDKVW